MFFLFNVSGFIQIIAWCFLVHPVHVSVTEIEFVEKDHVLQVMMRVFVDDLETSLRKSLNQPEFDILAPGKGITLDQLMSDYLKVHFKIYLDNQVQQTNYLGHERESEAFIFYVQVSDVKKWKTIKVQNDIIMATYDDQSNLVHVYIGDKVKSLRLTKNTPADKLTFEEL